MGRRWVTSPSRSGKRRNGTSLSFSGADNTTGFFFYPRELCPVCLSDDLEWAPVSGRGRVHAFTIVYQPNDARFNDETPYVYAVIQLDEGARMISNVIDIEPHDVEVDMPVVAVFEDITPEWTLVKFKPA